VLEESQGIHQGMQAVCRRVSAEELSEVQIARGKGAKEAGGIVMGVLDWIPGVVLLGLLGMAERINLVTGLLPNRLTYSGTLLGVALSAAFPKLIGGHSSVHAMGLSVLGAATSLLHVVLIVSLLKPAYGLKKLRFPQSVPFRIFRQGDEAFLEVNGNPMPLQNFFRKDSDVTLADADWIAIRTKGAPATEYCSTNLKIRYGWIEVDDARHVMEEQTEITGAIRSLLYHRDVIGWGAMKLLMLLGAFLGWQGAIFVFWVAIIVLGVHSLIQYLKRVPFKSLVNLEPYLMVGVIVWLGWQFFA
jgi:leader peptidase (prepilin peptidase)/N-methyltransferase